MTSDVKDLAVERIISNMSNVEAWQNAGLPHQFEEFHRLYSRPVYKLARSKKPQKTEYLYYGEISEQQKATEKTQSIENICREASTKYKTGIIMGNVEYEISYVYSRMAIMAINYIDDAYKNLDKSVAELQLLADNEDMAAYMMLPVVKVMNWKSDDK